MGRFEQMGFRFFSLSVLLSAVSCTNPTTLQTAHPLAQGQQEHGLSAAGYYLEQTDLIEEPVIVLPAYSYRKGLEDDAEFGVRMTAPLNVQFDGKASWVWGRAALAAGLGMESDVISILYLAATNQDDDENDTSDDDDDDDFPLTVGLFVPLIASYEVVPEYLSIHLTGRMHGMRAFDRWGAYASGAGGVRVGKDFGLHVEAAPAVTTTGDLIWFAGAQLFYRPEHRWPPEEHGESE